MTIEGGGPPIDWAALAPLIEHPARESIVEALRWVGPLSAPDLKRVLEDPELHVACIAYHASVLVEEEVLVELGQRQTGRSIERVFFLRSPA
jgi:hypothetical protein